MAVMEGEYFTTKLQKLGLFGRWQSYFFALANEKLCHYSSERKLRGDVSAGTFGRKALARGLELRKTTR